MTKPKWNPIKIKLGDIKAYDENPRMSTKAQAERIIASEKKFNQVIPFIVGPFENGKALLYDGHQRLSAWQTIHGADYEMDAMQSDRPLTDEEHKELIVTLHTGATGSWDWNRLSGWDAPKLQEWGMTKEILKEWNNDANNLQEFINSEGEDLDIGKEWEGMPEYNNKDMKPFRQIIISFLSQDDIDNFSLLINQKITDKTKSIQIPERERERLQESIYE